MEKQHLKRIGYGFSALVLGLSAVNFFPLTGAYAIPAASECTEDDTTGCFVTVATHPVLEDDKILYVLDESAPLAFSGTYNGDLIAYLDGAPVADGSLEAEDGNFALNLALTTPGEHELKFRILQDLESATSNVTFAIFAIPSAHIDSDLSKTVNIYDSFSMSAGIYSGYEAYKISDTGAELITDDDMTITESGDGEYELMPIAPGRYNIDFIGFVESNGKWAIKHTGVYLTVVGATTEAATTITDLMNAQNEANMAIQAAMAKYDEEHPDASDEERYAEMDRLYAEIGQKAGLNVYNAFREDTMAIYEAVEDGKMIATAVSADELDEADVEEEVKAALLEKLDATFASNVKYYNIDVNVYADGEFIGTLKELTGKQVVVLSGFEAAPAGYKRVYKVLGYHTYIDENGEEQVEIVEIDNVEFDEETGSIIFGANKFSTYLVAYKDELNASVNTGVFTGENGSASASALTSVIAVVAAITLAGVFKFAKSRK